MAKPTLQDVADNAGVSIATASRVINNHNYVSDEARSVVMEAAIELGYTGKQATNEQDTCRQIIIFGGGGGANLAAVQSLASNEFVQNVYRGVLQVAAEENIDPVFNPSIQLESMFSPEYSKEIKARKIGCMLLGGSINTDLVLELASTGLPIVIVGAYFPEHRFNCISADYLRLIDQAVTHLTKSGRKRIGLVNGPPQTVTSRDKYKGFMMALAVNSCEIHGNEVVDSPTFNPQDGAEMTKELMNQMPDVDAIIYGDDYLAIGGLKMLEELDKDVPDEIAIVGCHDYSIAEFTKPGLTTMHIRMGKMGSIAVYRLISMMEHQEKNIMDVIVPGYLTIRESA